MDERRRGWAVATVAMLVALACSGPMVTGDAMIDAGELLEDAGRALADAGDAMLPDASAQAASYEAECDRESLILRTTNASTGAVLSEQVLYYAEWPNAAIDTTSDVHVVVCDRVVLGIDPEMCGAGTACERAPLEQLPCATVATDPAIQLGDGLVRVQCGNRYMYRGVDGVEHVTGERWDRVHFSIRR